jgi:hypothetical protein
MGTSNWQNIPFCIEALMKIAPTRVLDIGVGYGRWGMIVREFCDIWYGRVFRADWTVQIEGVEGFAPNIGDYHNVFYNKIHIGDFRKVVATLSGKWSVVIFGDVLEHFEKSEANDLLAWALQQSDYVIVNIPLGAEWPQENLYDNPYERHLSTWMPEDFLPFSVRRQAFFKDYIDRPFGSFILSLTDPRNLLQQLFSRNTANANQLTSPNGVELSLATAHLLEEVRALASELRVIKGSRSYRAVRYLKRSRLGGILQRAVQLIWPDQGGLVRSLVRFRPRAALHSVGTRFTAPRDNIQIEATGQRNSASQGNEVWLLAVQSDSAEPYDLDQVKHDGQWLKRANDATPTGHCLVSSGKAYAFVPSEPDVSLLFMTHPWSGKVRIGYHRQQLEVDLYNKDGGTALITPATSAVSYLPALPARYIHGGPAVRSFSSAANRFRQSDQRWLEEVTPTPRVVSLGHPAWRGIRSSASQLFDSIYELDDTLDEESGRYYARLFAEANCPAVVIQGFPLTYRHLVNALHKIAPQLPVYVIWHGNFTHTSEDYAWTGFRAVEDFCRAGAISKWGFVKRGMAEIMATRGLRTGFVMNMVRSIPEAPSSPMAGGPHLGIWSIYTYWRKQPYEMLAASCLLKDAIIHTAGADNRVLEFANFLDLKVEMQPQAIDQDRMPQTLTRMHLNMYVTLNDCAPMLPLESLAAGVPCLIGTSSYYFEDHDFLHRRLVVHSPDTAAVIARYTQSAIEEREAIIAAYRTYAPEYNSRAHACLEAFLEIPMQQIILS